MSVASLLTSHMKISRLMYSDIIVPLSLLLLGKYMYSLVLLYRLQSSYLYNLNIVKASFNTFYIVIINIFPHYCNPAIGSPLAMCI